MKEYIYNFSLGVTIGVILSLIFSALKGSTYYFVTPDAIEYYGNLNASVIAFICYGLIGLMSYILSRVYENTHNLLKATSIHFVLMFLTIAIVGKILLWFDISILKLVSFFVIFAIVYVIIWLNIYYYYKKLAQEMNKKINSKIK